MKRIDQVLGGEVFHIDSLSCSFAAECLKKYKSDTENNIWSAFPLSIQLAFKIPFISICHDFNWDFMQDTLARHILEDKGSDLIDKLEKVDARVLAKWLSEYPKPERIRASERAAYLRDVARNIHTYYDGSAANILKKSNLRLAGTGGFFDRLVPDRKLVFLKKSTTLIQ